MDKADLHRELTHFTRALGAELRGSQKDMRRLAKAVEQVSKEVKRAFPALKAAPVPSIDQGFSLPVTVFDKARDYNEPMTRANPSDAGLDLRASAAGSVRPHDRAIINTNLAMAIPDGYVGLVCPRSGMAAKHGVTVTNAPGIIDSSYRGEVKVLLSNHSDHSFEVEPGDRVAQLVIVPCALWAVEVVETLEEGERGDAGFGSSGR